MEAVGTITPPQLTQEVYPEDEKTLRLSLTHYVIINLTL